MNERYLIFGGTGSLGKKMIQRLIAGGRDVFVYSRDESKHWTIRNELAMDVNKDHAKFIVGDIRDYERVKESIMIVKPTKIVIAAALKHVDTCELSPFESVQTNLLGTQNVIKAVKDIADVYTDALTHVLFVSTDKACSPINVYGMCKALSERLVTQSRHRDIKHVCVRYGNVLESRGSIIPLFKYQTKYADRLTVTDPNMTRFLMTLDDSYKLINMALTHAQHGQTWIPIIPAMRIGDLAEVFAERFNKSITVTGLRPGEKMHEDLINRSESMRTSSLNDHYYVIESSTVTANNARQFVYSSNDDVMTKDRLRQHLESLGVLDAPLETFTGKHIEEIRQT